MTTLTIKGLPEDIYVRLKQRAEAQRRSLNREVILCLEQALGSEPLDLDAWLAAAARLRQRIKGPKLTDARLRELRRKGRR